MSFFEGSEKKLEVVVNFDNLKASSLLEYKKDFWSQVVESSQAQILSEIQTDDCVAYLLSESSLFVFKTHFTMITCGQTTLAKAFLKFQETVPSKNISSFIYERKNEVSPKDQKSSFSEDVNAFQEIFNQEGQEVQFGEKSNHFIELYEFHKNFTLPEDEATLELLMYNVSEETKAMFFKDQTQIEKIHEFFNFNNWASEFEIDDYIFDPQGYSVNALKGSEYFTIHVTPQKEDSYVSFETNIKKRSAYDPLIDQMLELFKPRSYDVLDFKYKCPAQFEFQRSGYTQKSYEYKELNSGFVVSYAHMDLSETT